MSDPGWQFAPLALLLCLSCQGPELCLGASEQAIIDGETPGEDERSATAALLVSAEASGEVLAELACSAVLIAPDVVLTAAHCIALYQFEDEPEVPPVSWYVSFSGDVSAFEAEGGPLPEDAILVRALEVHPGFSLERKTPKEGLGKMDDLAVLFLGEEVTGVRPAPLLTPGESLQVGSEVLIEGYGLVDADDLELGLGIKRFGTSYLFDVGEYELRVGRALSADEPVPRGVADKCYGDSGGPTFLQTGAGRVLVGVTSRGYQARAECGIAGVDTRVDAYAEWIEEQAVLACLDGRRAPSFCGMWPSGGARSGDCLQ